MERFDRVGSTGPRWALACILLAGLAIGAAPAALAQQSTAPEPGTQDPEARQILVNMAAFVAQSPGFSVTLRSGYDAVQQDGQVIEFGEQRRIVLRRPDGLRLETIRSDGERGMLLFDGRVITAFSETHGIYSKAEVTGTVDDALVYLVRDLEFTLPLARLLHTGFPQLVEDRFAEISYVEENVLFDVVTDHVAIRSDDVDVQMWIAQGDEPLPRRIIINYKNALGQPQFRGDFIGWSLGSDAPADTFAFSPPEGAELIPMVVRAPPRGSLPAQQGGQ
jgi:hypothetical protein